MSKFLLDTNILVYAKDKNSQFHTASLEFISGNNEYFVSSKNLSEYYAVVTRGISPLLSVSDALSDLHEWSLLFTVLYPTQKSNALLIQLLAKYQPKGLRVHDFEILAIAQSNMIDKIVSINSKDFPSGEIEILIPS